MENSRFFSLLFQRNHSRKCKVCVIFIYWYTLGKLPFQPLKVVMSHHFLNKYMKNAACKLSKQRTGGILMKREAIFDETGTYRYSLSRVWDGSNNRKVTFVLLHPGTADEHKEDATTNKCILLAKRWGFGSLEIVTLFAYQSNRHTLLKELMKEEAVGYDNDRYIQYAVADADLVVAAWGENCTIHGRDRDMASLLEGVPLCCLGTTYNHYPRHPLFVPYNVSLERLYFKPISLLDYDEMEARDIIDLNTFDPYESTQPVQRIRSIKPLKSTEEEDDSWIFCTCCYDEYPMHGRSICHSCYEKQEKEGTAIETYDYMI
jgi:hypothetical protein